MQLHKFCGRTLQGTLARVRRQLGPDALILETRTIQPGSPAARMNPGARYEICAVREAPAAPMPATPLREPVVPQPAAVRLEPVGVATRRRGVVEDLAELRSQIRDLLDDSQPETRLAEARLDLEEYRALLRLGIA